MSSFIGQLRISLGIDSAAFESGAKRAAAEVNTLGSKAERAGFKVGSMTKALVAGASAFAATAIVSQLKSAVDAGLEYAASLGETAQQLGVTTKTLQEYRYAADQVGISQDEMDTGLAKLTRTIGQAVEGGKKQSAAFEKLGISVRDANGNVKDAGDIIPELADALQKLGSPAERAAVLVELFGKSGMKMGSLLADGAKGVNSLRADAEKLGIVMSDSLINKADAASDKMASLNKIITAKISIAVAENADSILKLADAFGTLIDKASQAINWISRFADEMSKADLGLTKYVKQLEDAGILAKGAAGKYGGLYGLDENGNPKKNAPPAPVPSSGGALLRLPGKTGTFTPGKGPLAGFAGGNALLGSNIANIAAQAPGLRTPLFEGLLYQTEEIQNSLSKVNKAANDTADQTDASTVRIAKSFADMAQDTVAALQNMSTSIRSGDFLSILGSAVGLFTQLASTGLFGKTLAARVNKVPAYAGGTNFHPGGLAMVGERGPELVSLPRGSQVYPNGTGPGGGPSSIQIIPSRYFDVVVDGRVLRAAPAIAGAGGEIGYNKVARTNSRRLA
jgi:hypothetical protein